MFSLIKYGVRAAVRMPRVSFFRFPGFRLISTTQDQQARDHVTSIVMDTLKGMDKCNVSKLTPNATFEDIGLDSLDQVEAVCEIEDKLGFDLSTEEAEKITNVQEALTVFLAHYLKRQQKAPQGTPSAPPQAAGPDEQNTG